MVSVATAKVEGRRRSWTGAEGCPLDPFDATDEPSGCSPSQSAIRRSMIVFNHQFGKFSHSCCVDSQTSVTRQSSRQRKEPLLTEIDVSACEVRPPPAVPVMDGVPDKKLVVVDHQLRKSIAGVREKELDKHRAVRSCQAGWLWWRGVESTSGPAWSLYGCSSTYRYTYTLGCPSNFFLYESQGEGGGGGGSPSKFFGNTDLKKLRKLRTTPYTVSPEYFVCILFSYVVASAGNEMRTWVLFKFHLRWRSAVQTYISCIRKVGGP